MKKGIIGAMAVMLIIWVVLEFAAAYWGVWVYAVAGVIVAGFLYPMYKHTKEQKQMVDLLLDQGDPKAFVEALEEEMKKPKDEYSISLMRINLSSGLCYQGHFNQALKELKKINTAHLEPQYLTQYYNNIVNIHFLSGKEEEALRVYEEARPYLEQSTKHKELIWAVKGTHASIQLMKANYDQAKEEMEGLLNPAMPKLMQATVAYLMARIASATGDAEALREHVESVKALGGKTILVSLAEKMSK